MNPAYTINSLAYEASHVLRSIHGTLVGLLGYNSGPAQFIQLHDAAALPADGAVPLLTVPVPAGGEYSIDLPPDGLPFVNGIVCCNSSTGPTKTIGAADQFFTAVIQTRV